MIAGESLQLPSWWLVRFLEAIAEEKGEVWVIVAGC
jgi:hypothetical protein